MKYLFTCAETYIKDSHAFGSSVWDSVKEDVIFILSHPNGWEGAQQVAMRKAAVKANLIPDTGEGHDRVQFVTEGEASFNFCVNSGVSGDAMEVGMSHVNHCRLAECWAPVGWEQRNCYRCRWRNDRYLRIRCRGEEPPSSRGNLRLRVYAHFVILNLSG